MADFAQELKELLQRHSTVMDSVVRMVSGDLLKLFYKPDPLLTPTQIDGNEMTVLSVEKNKKGFRDT